MAESRSRGKKKTSAKKASTKKRSTKKASTKKVARKKAGAAKRSRTELGVEDLAWSCPPLEAAKRLPRICDLLGQERPLAALTTGAKLHAAGYNIFVSGSTGSGRTRLVTDFLRKLQPCAQAMPDRVFVSNFREPNRPRLISLPRGDGPRFREEMRELVQTVQEALSAALRSRVHRVSRDLVERAAEEREQRLMVALDRQARRDGCAVVQFPGPNGGAMADVYPLVEDEPVNPEAMRDLVLQGQVSRDEWLKLRARREQLMDRLEEVTDRLVKMGRETDDELRRMDRQLAEHVLGAHLREFKRRWTDPQVLDFLAGLREYVMDDLETWVNPGDNLPPRSPSAEDGEASGEDASGATGSRPAAPEVRAKTRARESSTGDGAMLDGGPVDGLGHDPAANMPIRPPEPVRMLGVEVHLVKSSGDDGCPIVVETHPTYSSLFGSVEPARDGYLPGLSQVHAGAMIRADGGFLVLRMPEVLAEPGVWGHLKRALKVRSVEIREHDPNTGVSVGAMQPEAVPVDLKVILIGDSDTYEALAMEDRQFLQIFKIHAEFDSTMDATRSNLRRYANLLGWLSEVEGLAPFSPDAAAAVAEYGARVASHRKRLTTRYGRLADLAREASFLASASKKRRVARQHVEEALAARRYRRGLGQEHVERDFRAGYLLLRTKGAVVGQVNAMTVVEIGTAAFGKPSRITAVTGAGSKDQSRLVNIEREAELSGPLYDKGIMIMEGFLLDRFAQDSPICMQAALCFEQTYHGIDGDSATLAELIAILSSLSRVPVRQSMALTGSLNQRGEVQAVSGVNQKIEGFFRCCVANGLDGQQGVVLPRANIDDLMLSQDVLEAVHAGKFHIHAIRSVEEAIPLVMDDEAKTVLERAGQRLRVFSGQR